MRQTKKTKGFKKDHKRFKRIVKSKYGEDLDDLLSERIDLLEIDAKLPESAHDHPLKGEWTGSRSCRLKPNLMIIYEKSKDGKYLVLHQLGTHADLYGL